MTTILLSRVPPSANGLLRDYADLGSCRRVGAKYGVTPQTAHKWLKDAGYQPNMQPHFTPEQVQAIKDYYENTPSDKFDLKAFAKSQGRTPSLICRVAGIHGLTRQGRRLNSEYLAKTKAAAQGRWSRKPHPRGALGMKHSPETRAKISECSKRAWATMKTFGIGNMTTEAIQARSDRMAGRRHGGFSRCKGGYREDLGGLYVRSSWEANYARYLNLLLRMGVITAWDYEAEAFWFHEIKRGTRTYTPDFRVFYKGEAQPTFVEIKGWMDAASKTRLKRMKKYYPDVRLELVGQKEYTALARKWKTAIPNWEGK